MDCAMRSTRACEFRLAESPLLEVLNLTIEFATEAGRVRAVDGLNLRIAPGEVLGLVGESGSGKSVTALAIMGLLPQPAARVTSGSIRFAGQELLALDRKALRRLRGAALSMIFQEPMTSLNPVLTVGHQMTETIITHERLGLRAARERAIELLAKVGIPAPARRMGEYPHRLSGGTRQRVMIAMALACGPRLLIADEPTTALDVTIQAQILDLLRSLQSEFRMAVLLITHNLGVVAEFADQLTVLYAGRAMEEGPVEQVFASPAHPYTSGLLASMPPLERRVRRLTAIPGIIPSGTALPPGCRFAPRCRHARPHCNEAVPELGVTALGHATACVRYGEFDLKGADSAEANRPADVSQAPLLVVEDLHKRFAVGGDGWLRRTAGAIHAVEAVSFSVSPRETLALVGESGCGKTTVAHLVLGLHEPSAGRITFDGVDSGSGRPGRRGLQIVFQDPAGSLDPRMVVGQIVAEPLAILGWPREQRNERVQMLLERVGLGDGSARRYPHEFSGGQRQRIAIARALAPAPKLIVCDEPVSALDVSIQAQILNLLHDLQDQFGLAYLFISHDLGVVRQVADRVAVMYLGRIVEIAYADDLFLAPRHPYTQALLAAVPTIERGRKARHITVAGDIPDPLARPTGCGFRTRCPRATNICANEAPALEAADGMTHLVACHFRNAS
jgi:peptide/nickel transport system ATP-binding protein